MSNKSIITIRLVDAVGSPVRNRKYEVRNQQTGQLIAIGPTNEKGCIVEISRDKGTVLDISFESIFSQGMSKIQQSIVMSKDRMIVTMMTKEIKVKLSTKENQGSHGKYKRKTYVVKKGDTLTAISHQNNTTVRALVLLNNLKDPDQLNIGQVLKLPVNIPATGNHHHQDRQKSPQAKKSVPQLQSTKSSDTGYLELAKKKLDEYYEGGKKKIDELVKSAETILTVDDRSQATASPKAEANNLCKTKPQCISSGKSELIREVNIRLAGFGGALPTDEFTELTANCIKQFQRDYMGAPETGKICGSLLVALDKFNKEFPLEKYMLTVACPCEKYGGGSKCEGFGAKRTKQYKVLGEEAPGMHRSTMWILKAVHFYLEKEKNLGVKIVGISSGYRCIENNAGHNSERKIRTTVNHMSGAALDILINDNSKLNEVRQKIFIKYMRAAAIGTRENNCIFLESKEQHATSWIHFDILMYESLDPKNLIYYGTSVPQIINQNIIELCKKSNNKILSCSVIIPEIENTSHTLNMDKNIKAFLDTIAKSEGTYDLGENGYNVMVTGKLFKDYLDHPFTHSTKAFHVSGNLYSTASGRYQIMRNNWYGVKEDFKTGLKYQLGLTNFSPDNQDIAAIALLKRRNAYKLIAQGKIRTAFRTTSLNKEWASFPGAGYKQKEHKIEKILSWYKKFGGTLTD